MCKSVYTAGADEKAAGELNVAEEARLLGDKADIFTEEQKLSKVEKCKITPRALIAQGFGDAKDDNESSSEDDYHGPE